MIRIPGYFALAVLAMRLAAQSPEDVFLQKPYLQLGDHPQLLEKEQLDVAWLAADADARWSVRYKAAQPKAKWQTAEAAVAHRVLAAGVPAHRVYQAPLTNLGAGDDFDYEVLRNGEKVFTAHGRARPSANQFYRMVIFGDSGADTPAQRAIAFQAYQLQPNMVFITGDIVYNRGRASEYFTKYFPIYNADKPSPLEGAPLLRSTLFMAAVGNHDVSNDFSTGQDSFAYFYYWMQPLNGPLGKQGSPNAPALRGPQETQDAFLAAAGTSFPRMANFSFEYGNAHWTVLDGNPYVDWSQPELRDWLTNDLKAARKATWRFVAFHHPGFNSAQTHFSEQQMRLIAEICEQANVDVIFTGHVHNY